MSYVQEIYVVKNDYGYDLEFKITDVSGENLPLTGATAIKVFIAEPETTVAKVVDDCTPTDEEAGECKYTVQDGDFDEADKIYEAEIEVTYSDKVVTAKGVIIHVERELPETKT